MVRLCPLSEYLGTEIHVSAISVGMVLNTQMHPSMMKGKPVDPRDSLASLYQVLRNYERRGEILGEIFTGICGLGGERRNFR